MGSVFDGGGEVEVFTGGVVEGTHAVFGPGVVLAGGELGGDLEGVEDQPGALGVAVGGLESLDDLADGEQDGGVVFDGRELEDRD